MRYLFLDIDGVLNHEEWYNSKRLKELAPTFVRWEQECFDPACVKRVNEILEETGAQLVVSSSWRSDTELPNIFKLLGLPTDFMVTPLLVDEDSNGHLSWPTRGEEIEAFINEHPCNNYVIVDDDTDFTEEQKKKHFVRTYGDYVTAWKEDKCWETGLTEAKKDKIIKTLKNE